MHLISFSLALVIFYAPTVDTAFEGLFFENKLEEMVDSLFELATQLTRITVPIAIVIGTIGNVLNIYIFTRRHFLNCGCTLYFLALSINNLFYSTVLLSINLLSDGYGMSLTETSDAFCKILSYALNLSPTLSAYFLVFASINRYFASSIRFRYRQWSARPRARQMLIFVISFFSLFCIGIFLAFEVRPEDGIGCTTQYSKIFNQIFLCTEMTLYVVIAPFLMCLFGALTILNRRKFAQLRRGINRSRRTETELIRILILQIAIHLILALPFSTIFLMLVLPISWRSTLIFRFLFVTCKIPLYFTFVSPFFTYTLFAHLYRQELRKLWRKMHQFYRTNIVLPINAR